MQPVFIKGAIFNIFILAIDEMTIHNVKGVTQNDKITENYHPTPKCPPALRSISASLSSLF